MKLANQRPSVLRSVAAVLAAVAAVAACTTGEGPQGERTGSTSSALFSNGGFETGAANAPPVSWTVQPYLNPDPTGVTIQTPETRAGLNLGTGGKPLTDTIAAVNQADPDLGAGASLRVCRYGNQCARVNFHSSTTYGNGENVNSLSQTMTVGAGDVDPSDNKVHVRFVVAPVLQNPSHPVNEQPYYMVQLTDLTTSALLYSDFNLSAQPGVPWKTVNGGTAAEIDYTDWSLVDITPTGASLAMGDMVKLEVIAGGCSLGGHFGEIYLDGLGPTVPGLFVTGTGPAQANAGTDVTYALTYHNGGGSAETGVVIDFTTPPSTTYQSITPPAGATCVTPAVGAAGTVTCTFSGPVAAGASGAFTITVAINAGTSGSITAGTYDIRSTQETALLGNKITTIVGCTLDAQCPAGDWCDENVADCTPKLANGSAVPTDAPHANPTLNGTCTAGAGALVCASAVCDTPDNRCGYANADGPCTAANGGVVCRSGACDPDGKCGYANGDGPCTAANGGTVCRSAACSANGLCRLPGGCNVDADCTGGSWCDETSHACTPKEPNGTLVPNDPPHTSPTLNGTCTAAAGTLVCGSGACDASDNKCGYANGDGPCTASGASVCRSAACDPDGRCGYAVGDGPCTAGSAATVCRSGACSTSGACEPSGGCDVDADCTGPDWCDESLHACTAPLANGLAIPTDAPHVGPTLTGNCTAAAGMLVCTSAVCDTGDNACGYANGDGPCTATNAGTVCRSGTCSTNSLCEPSGGCNLDADCTRGNWCDQSAHTCTPQLANGKAIPTDPSHANPTLGGSCTAAAGVLVCASGVCDTMNNECGYADGDGPCTVATGPTVCQSGVCSKAGTCEVSGGCNVDADCAAGQWCDESLHGCRSQVPNGMAIPTDAPHTNPTLDGTCTAPAATLVCQSGVCDTKDNACGYANGDGPCAQGDAGAAVCRSGACGTSSSCEPAGGCNHDSDCTDPAKPVCDPTTSTCKAVADAGSDAGPAAPDSGPESDGATAAPDSGPESDGAPAPSEDAAAEASDSGYVEGGGCSIGHDRAPTPRSIAELLVGVGLVLGGRRRRP